MARTIEGIGVVLRPPFAAETLSTTRRIDWVEIAPEHWLEFGGRYRRTLEQCVARWPVVPHTTGATLGGPEPLDAAFLARLDAFCREADAPYFSDHIAFLPARGRALHEPLPLPFNPEAINAVAARVAQVRKRVSVPLVLENVAYYARMPGSTLDESSFVRAVLEVTGTELALDLNAVHVNSSNHGFDAYEFVDRLPLDRLRQIHLAGHTTRGGRLVDTRSGPVSDAVWALYRYALSRTGRMVPTVIDWDAELPALDRLLDEVDRARAQARSALSAAALQHRTAPARPGVPLSDLVRAMGPFVAGEAPLDAVASALYGDARHPEAAGLSLYGQRYAGECLRMAAQVFPRTERALRARDPAAWDALVAAYFAQSPRGGDSLHAALGGFVEFLEQKLAPRALPAWLVEVADLEWREWQALVAPDATRDAEPERGPVRLASTAHLGVYQHDVLAWLEAGADAAEPQRAAATPVLVVRTRELEVRRLRPTGFEQAIVTALSRGEALAPARERVGATAGEWQSALAALRTQGIVLGVELEA